MSLTKMACGTSTTTDLISNVNGLIDSELSYSRGNKFVLLGDSITQQDSYYVGSDYYTSDRGYFNLANASLDWPFDYVNSGIPGNTTAQMLARIEQDVIAHSPYGAIVFGGVNDLAAASPTDTSVTIANLTAIYNVILESGAKLICCTVPMTSGQNVSSNATVNLFIESFAASNNLDVVDFAAALTDVNNTTSPFQKTGVTADLTHPNRLGAKYMSEKLAPILSKYASSRPRFLTRNSVSGNAIDNTLNTGTSGSVPTGSAPTGYSLYNAAVNAEQTHTGSIRDSDDKSHKIYRITSTNTGSSIADITVSKTSSTVPVAGAVYVFSAEVDIVSAENWKGSTITMRFMGASSTTLGRVVFMNADDGNSAVAASYIGGGSFTSKPMTCPSGALYILASVKTLAKAAVIDIGRLQCVRVG